MDVNKRPLGQRDEVNSDSDSSTEPKRRKRQRIFYTSDGRKLVSVETMRRRRKLFAAARAAYLGNVCVNDVQNVEKKSPASIASAAVAEAGVNEEQSNNYSSSDHGVNHGSLDSDSHTVHHSALNVDSSTEGSVNEGNISDASSIHSSSSTTSSTSWLYDDDSPFHFNFDKVRNFVRSGGDAIMFHESNLMAWQVILVILGLYHRFSLSLRGRRALVEAAKLFAGPNFINWNISNYQISKIFDAPDAVIRYHFYCEVCWIPLDEPTTKLGFKKKISRCTQCSARYALSMNSDNYFITLDLKYQLTALINLPAIKEALFNNLQKIERKIRSNVSTSMQDVYDGLLYKKLFANTDDNSKLLTYVLNTDGAPLFKSSKRSLWPILLILNELPSHIRFKYPLLVGLCVVKKEPSPEFMNMYLKSFVQESNKLSTEGFEVVLKEGQVAHLVLKALACSVDSVARPILQNRIQFNGYHGCSWCYSVGAHRHGCIRFLMEEKDPSDRTHKDYFEDCKAVMIKIRSLMVSKAKRYRTNVRGVKGVSILKKLHGFNMVWAFVRDYLHADLLGVVSQIAGMWSDPQCPIKLTNAQLNEVNRRLMKMTPPKEVHRLVRPITTEKAKWKASEWRSWLLFYSIPCLSGILNAYALQHYALFVRSIYVLLRTHITEEDLQRIDDDLYEFVIVFELLYGERYVTFNVHSLKHLVNSVRCCGPLWATSTFPFENAIHDLKKFVHGPKGVYEQIANKTMERNIMTCLIDELEDSPACSTFHKSLFGRSEVASLSRTRHGVVFIGKGREYDYNLCHKIECEGDDGCGANVLMYKRCIYSGMVVHTVAYDSAHKSNNTMFIDIHGRFLKVLHLLYHNGGAYAEVAYFRKKRVVIPSTAAELERTNFKNCPVIKDIVIDHLFIIGDNEYLINVIPVVELREKCVLMTMDETTYVSRIPNKTEIQ